MFPNNKQHCNFYIDKDNLLWKQKILDSFPIVYIVGNGIENSSNIAKQILNNN